MIQVRSQKHKTIKRDVPDLNEEKRSSMGPRILQRVDRCARPCYISMSISNTPTVCLMVRRRVLGVIWLSSARWEEVK